METHVVVGTQAVRILQRVEDLTRQIWVQPEYAAGIFEIRGPLDGYNRRTGLRPRKFRGGWGDQRPAAALGGWSSRAVAESTLRRDRDGADAAPPIGVEQCRPLVPE